MIPFGDIYEKWTDEELLHNFEAACLHRDSYQEEALQVMQNLIKKRGLKEPLSGIYESGQLKNKEAEEDTAYHQKMTLIEDEIQNFGSQISNREYARSARQENGVYFERNLGNLKNASRATPVLVIGILLIVASVFYISTIDHGHLTLFGLLFIAAAIFFNGQGVYLIMSQKVILKLYENEKGQIILEIVEKFRKEEMLFPFPYKFCCTSYSIGFTSGGIHTTTITNPVLYLLIARTSGRSISISEIRSAGERIPQWEPIEENRNFVQDPITYSNHAFSRTDLKFLKKILDGLSENVNDRR